MGAQEQVQPQPQSQGWAHVARLGGESQRFDLSDALRTPADALKAANVTLRQGETVNIDGENVAADKLDKIQLQPNTVIQVTGRIANGAA
jgi:hypothetical protein